MKYKEDFIWVAVSLFEGEKNAGVEYYGKIEKRVYTAIISNRLQEGFFKLESVGWMGEDGEVIKLRDVAISGKSYGYQDTAFFRVELISRMILLKDEFVMLSLKLMDA